jgi:predicted RNA-binding protein with RPS1 domain
MVAPGGKLQVGTLVLGEIVAHHPWGVDVRLLFPKPEIMGLIDLIWVTDERPFEPFVDYPSIGQQVEAVVITYTPNGQLRLSTRVSDVDRAKRE